MQLSESTLDVLRNFAGINQNLLINPGSTIKTISEANPFFYMIDGFRYCFIGNADGSIKIGIIYLTILSFLSWLVTYILFKRGYKIKS